MVSSSPVTRYQAYTDLQVVANNPTVDGPERVIAADIDGDGDRDIVGVSVFSDDILWWANTDGAGTFGSANTVVNLPALLSDATVADIDGDNDPDVVAIKTSTGGIIWYANDGSGAGWTSTDVALTFASGAAVEAADLDGDGDLDIVAGGSGTADDVVWFENTGGGSTWQAPSSDATQNIDLNFDGIYRLHTADVDGDGDIDVLGAALDAQEIALWKNNGTGTSWNKKTLKSSFTNADAVYAADMDGDGDLDVAAGAGGSSTLVWIENSDNFTSSFTEHTISTSFNGTVGIQAVDADGDGRTDILAAAAGDDEIALFHNSVGDGSRWTKTQVETGFDGYWVEAADLDGDGDLDLLGADLAGDRFAWWQNKLKRPVHSFNSTQNIVSASQTFASDITAGDLDRDGDMDLIVADRIDDDILVFSGNSGTSWTQLTAESNVDAPESVDLGDIDGDGDLDILSAAAFGDSVVWYKTSGGLSWSWTSNLVVSLGTGARPHEVAGGDFDGDGDLDIAATQRSGNIIAWYGNVNGDGSQWSATTVGSSPNVDAPEVLVVADIDNDGDLDLASAPNSSSASVAWWSNSGDGSSWTHNSIDANFEFVTTLIATDIDGDGDQDLVGGNEAGPAELAWWENSNGAGTFSTKNSITTQSDGNMADVYAADVDGDGDQDLLLAQYDNCGECGAIPEKVVWWANANGDGSSWSSTDIDAAFDGANEVFPVDVDGDGDVDVAAAAFADNEVVWYKNLSGPQTGVFGADLAYTENAAATVVNSDSVFIADTDDADFNSATLVVSYVAGGEGTDVLEIQDQGTGAGQVGVSGSSISYSGVSVGSFSGGTSGTSLSVSFSSAATSGSVQAVGRNVTFRSTSDNPGASRTLEFALTTSDGLASADSHGVALTAVNDAPVVNLDPDNSQGGADDGHTAVTYTENAAAVGIVDIADASVTDADDTGLSSMTLSVSGIADGASEIFALGNDTFPQNADKTATVQINEVQKVNLDGASGGTFTLQYNGEISTAITVDAANSNTATNIQNALNALTGLSVSVAVTATDVFEVRFITPAAMDVGSLIPDFGSMTGGGSPSITTLINGSSIASFAVSYTQGTGVFTVSKSGGGDMLINDVQALMRSMTYLNSSENPTSGNRVMTIVVNDGETSSADKATTITVTPVNDAPTVTGLIDSVTYAENTVNATEQVIDTDITFDDIDDPADFDGGNVLATYSVGGGGQNQLRVRNEGNSAGEIGVSGSTVSYGGTAIGTIDGTKNGFTGSDLQINLNASATEAAVDALLQNLSYVNTFDAPAATRTVSITVDDGDGGVSTAATTVITITPENDAPIVSAVTTTLGHTEGGGAQLIDNDVAFSDPDGSSDFNGGNVTVTYSSGGGAEDQLSVRNEGTAGGQIGVSGTTVSFGGQPIGTIATAGANGADLVINLNTATASATAVDALIQNLTYENTADAPTASRTLSLTVNDGDGGTSDADAITVTVTGVNDAPTLTGVGNPTFAENTVNAAAQVIDADVTFDDPDDPASLNGGNVTVAYSSGGGTEDQLSVRNEGTSAGQISVSGTTVSYGGAAIGTISTAGANGANLVISLNTANATEAAVDALLQNLTYQNTSDTPTLSRVLSITVNDGAGGTSSAAFATITVTPENDAPVFALDSPFAYTENSGVQVIDSSISFSDPDLPSDFDTGVLQVTYSAGGGAEDQLSFSAVGGLQISGNNLQFNLDGFLTVATISGTNNGVNGNSLEVTFNGQATAVQVDLILQALSYQNTSENPAASRTLSVTVSDGNGGTSAAQAVVVNVTGVNDAPTLTGVDNPTFAENTVNAAGQIIDADVTLADVDVPASLNGGNVTVTYSSGGGTEDQLSVNNEGNSAGQIGVSGTTVSYGGAAIGTISTAGANGADLVISLNQAAATLMAVDALLQNLTYQNTSDAPTASRVLSITVNDGAGGTSSAAFATVTVTAENDVPVVTMPSGDLAYTEMAGPVAVDAAATLVDADLLDLGGGSVVLSVTANGTTNDRLSVQTGGSISVSGTTITGSGFTATFNSDGDGDTPLTVTLGAGATIAGVQDIVRNLTFDNQADAPSPLARSLSLTVNDGDGGTSAAATKTVNFTLINDAPVLTGLDSPTFAENTVNAAAQVIDAAVVLTDPDLPVSLNGGSVLVVYSAGGGAEDQLSVRNEGTGTGQIGVSGTTVSYEGAAIGTISTAGANGANLLINLNTTAATVAAVDALIQNLTYQNTSDTPTASRTLLVTVSDGANASAVSAVVTVTAENDVPTLSGLDSPTFAENTVNAAAQRIDNDVTFADVDLPSSLNGGTVTVTYSSGGGAEDQLSVNNEGTSAGQIGVSGTTVSYGGAAIGTISTNGANGADLVISLDQAAATVVAVDALLQNLTYQNTSDAPTASRVLSITVNDGAGGTSSAAFATVTVTAENDAPVVTMPSGDLAYTEMGGPVAVDAAATLVDTDLLDLGGGSVVLSVTANGTSNDRLSVQTGGSISVSGTTITGSGFTATFNSDADGDTPLTVTLGAGATIAGVQDILRNVTFDNQSDAPSTLARSVSLTVNDGDGGTSAAATKTVNFTSVNDAPVVTGLDGPTFAENTVNAAAQVIDAAVDLNDPDNPASLNGGNVTVTYSSGGGAEDQLSVRNEGNGNGQIGVSGTTVSYEGFAIGTISTAGANGADLVISLNSAAATVAAVDALLQNLTYQNTSDAPTASRTLSVTVNDGAGGTSNAALATVTVTAENDAPVVSGLDAAVFAENTVNAAGQLVDAAVGFVDADNPADLNGGSVTVSYASGGSAEDQLTVQHEGNGNGQVGVSGTVVSYEGFAIGTITSNGANGADLVISLNSAAATVAAVDALLDHLLYQNTSDAPTASRTLSVVVSDGDGGSSAAATATVTVNAENDAPVVTLPSGAASYTEMAAAVPIDAAATLSDADNSADFNGGQLTVSLTANGTVNDRLGLQHEGDGAGQIGVSGTTVSYGGAAFGSFNADADGDTPLVVTFNTAAASPAAVDGLLHHVVFSNVSDNPSIAARTAQFVVSDGDGGTSAAVTQSIGIVPVNDVPSLASFDSPVVFLENTLNAADQLIDTDVSLGDADSPDFDGGNVTVIYSSGGGAEDRLGVRNQGNGSGQVGVAGSSVTYGGTLIGTIAAANSGAAGDSLVIALTTAANAVSVEALLENLTYGNSSDAPTASRTLAITVDDGDNSPSAPALVTVNVTAENDAPAVSGLDAAAFAENTVNAAAQLIDAAVDFVDADNPADLDGGVVTVAYAVGGGAEDQLSVRHVGTSSGQIGVSGSTVSFGGTAFGTISTNGANGANLVINLNAASTVAAVDALLDQLQYQNTSDTPAASRTLSVAVSDGDGGSSVALTAAITVTAENDAPVVTMPSGAIAYTEMGGPVTVDAAATLVDADLLDLGGGSVVLNVTANGTTNDRLSVQTGGTISVSGTTITGSGFTATFNSDGDGDTPLTVTLGAGATIAGVQDILRNITFDNQADAPSALARSLSLTVNDGDGGTSAAATKTVNFTPVNDVPVLSNVAASVTLDENTVNAAAQVIDADVSLGDADSPDFDGGNVLVVYAAGGGAEDQLSVRHVGTSSGQIGVSGNTVSFGGAAFGTIDGDSSGTGGQPLKIVLNAQSTVASTEALVEHLQYQNTSDAPTASRTLSITVDDGDNSPSSPASVVVNVTPQNDAPLLDAGGDMSLTALVENDANPAGDRLETVIASAGGDRITDGDAGALEGIAVTSVDNSNGAWQYSTDDGANWTAFGTVGETSATLLAADGSTRLRFVPASDFSGAVAAGLSFRAWDRTTGSAGQNGVDASANGGATAFSAASETLSIVVGPLDADGTLTADRGLGEPVPLPSTATSAATAVDVLDLVLGDGGATDGRPLQLSQLVFHTSGDGPFGKLRFRLDGPDVSQLEGVYSAAGNTLTFAGLNIQVADGASQTYRVNAYYQDNSGLVEGQVLILSIDGDTDVTRLNTSTRMTGGNAAVDNAGGSRVDVTATRLVLVTPPSDAAAVDAADELLSGQVFGVQPVIEAQDAAGNLDTDFVDAVSVALDSGAGTFSGGAATAAAGRAVFAGLRYDAAVDGEGLVLRFDDAAGGAEGDLPAVLSSGLSADVVATRLVFATQPAGAVNRQVFGTPPVVEAQDAQGRRDTDFGQSVSLSTATVTLLNNTVSASGGVANFNALTAEGAATGVVLAATSSGVTAVNSAAFTVNNPAPTLSALTPPTAERGSGAFELVLTGSGFVPGSQVQWSGSARPTTFVSGNELRAAIPAADLQVVSAPQVRVFNSAPGGGTSASVGFAITFDVPPPPPVAALTVEPLQGNAPLTVRFTDASSGVISAWTLETRDDAKGIFTDRTQVVEGVYAQPGTYEALLTVVGPGGQAQRRLPITVNGPPQLGAVSVPPGVEDEDLVLDLAGVDPEDGTWSVTGFDPALVAAAVVEGDRVRLTPVADASGQTALTLVRTNGFGLAASLDVTAHWAAVNDPPTINGLPERIEVPEDEVLAVGGAAFGGDVDSPAAALVWNVEGAPEGLVAALSGGVDGVSLTPVGDAFGEAEVVVTLSDGAGGLARQGLRIAWTPVNDAPQAPVALSPAAGAAGAAPDPLLSWQVFDADRDVLTYDLFFGLDGAALEPLATGLTQASFGLVGLQPDSRYRWRVVVRDPAGESAAAEFDFSTAADELAPDISNVQVSTTEDGAVLSWETSEDADARLLFGIEALDGSASDPNLGRRQRLVLDGLEAGTFYQFELRSADAAGNVSEAFADRFRTLDRVDDQAPVALLGPLVEDLRRQSAALFVRTDEPVSVDGRVAPTGQPLEGGQALTSPELTTEHLLPVLGLQSGTDYRFGLRLTDASGNAADLPEGGFRTLAAADQTPPLPVRGPALASVGDRQMLIELETDELSTVEIGFGTDVSLANRRVVVSDQLKLAHQLRLVGLEPATLYFFRVQLRDNFGNTRLLEPSSVTTRQAPDTTPPVFVGGPAPDAVGDRRAVLLFNTDEPTRRRLTLSTAADLSQPLIRDNATLRAAHQVELASLLPDTEYFYEVQVWDRADNVALARGSFRTAAETDATPPQIVEGPFAEGIGFGGATVVWGTNELSTGAVRLQTAAGGEVVTFFSTRLGLSHRVQITGLEAATAYSLEVVATDAAGNVSAPRTDALTTLPRPDTSRPVVLSGPVFLAVDDAGASAQIGYDEPVEVAARIGLGAAPADVQVVAGSGRRASHEFRFTGLEPATEYSVQFEARDAAGNVQVTAASLRTAAAADQTPPHITVGPAVTDIGARTARLQWTLDELADAQVFLDETAVWRDLTRQTQHAVELTDLQPATEYAVRVVSADVAGNAVNSAAQTFRTLSEEEEGPPQIVAGPVAREVRATGAHVFWRTDEAADARLEYFPAGRPDEVRSRTLGTLETEHTVVLTNLETDTEYVYTARSRDAQGLFSAAVTGRLQTAAAADVTPPQILTRAVDDILDDQVRVRWTTDEPADSEVRLTGPDGVERVVADPEDVLDHTVILTNLLPDTEYSLVLASTDLEGNGPTLSAPLDVVTAAAPDDLPPEFVERPIVSGRTPTTIRLAWTTNEPTTATVAWGLTPALELGTQTRPDQLIDHDWLINRLQPGRTYFVRISVVDAAGNGPTAFPSSGAIAAKSFQGESGGAFTAQTLDTADERPPLILSGPIATQVTAASAVIEWETDEPADGLVLFETEGKSDFVVDPEFRRRHRQVLSNLVPGATYTFTVSSQDAARNTAAISAPVLFTTPGGLDTQAPRIIGGPVALDVTQTRATLTWTTDEPATSVVDYGPTAAYGIHLERGELVQEHSLALTDLTPGTEYRFKVSSRDLAGNLVSTDPEGLELFSQDHSFSTLEGADLQPPTFVVAPTVTWTHNAATVSWLTDELSSARVDWLGGEQNNFVEDNELRRDHSVTLTGLASRTLYFYKVTAIDAAGNIAEAGTEDLSPEALKAAQAALDVAGTGAGKALQPPGGAGRFVTNNRPDTRFPVIIGGPRVSGRTTSTLTIEWETDELADSFVRFGTADIDQVKGAARDVLLHRITLTNLEPDASYRYQVQSTDPSGNGATVSGLALTTTASEVDLDPPRFTSAPRIASRTDRSAVVAWRLDEAASSRIEYWPATDERQVVIRRFNQRERAPQVTLTNLRPSTDYVVRVFVIDASQNEGQAPIDVALRTDGQPDATPPRIVDGPRIVDLGNTSATIVWETDELGDSFVDFDTKPYLGQVVGSPELGLEHRVVLTNLTPETRYFYRVGSRDAAGNGPTESRVAVFTTAAGGDTEAPEAPDDLVATGGVGSVLLEWEANDEADLAGYTVYREIGGRFLPLSTNVSEAFFRDTGLPNGATFRYRVTATDRAVPANESAPSAIVEATPGQGQGPGAPVVLGLQRGLTPQQPIVRVQNASGATLYTIQISTRPDFGTIVDRVGNLPAGSGGETRWRVTRRLNLNTAYWFRARGSDGRLQGPWSASVQLRPSQAAALVASDDIDGDGAVSFADFFALAHGLGGADPLLDLNLDGRVDGGDVVLFGKSFGQGGSLKPSRVAELAVVEPAQLVVTAQARDDGQVEVVLALDQVGPVTGFGVALGYDPTALRFGSLVDTSGHPLQVPHLGIRLVRDDFERVLVAEHYQGRLQAGPLRQGELVRLRFELGGQRQYADLVVEEGYVSRGGGDVWRVGTLGRSRVLPQGMGLFANYPNPFNPATTIPFALPGGLARGGLSIYNALGQLVRVWDVSGYGGGYHALVWDGLDGSGRSVGSGLYIVRLWADGRVETRKIALIK